MNKIVDESGVRRLAEEAQATEHATRLSVTAHAFSGPMPPPEHLARYDRIVPGAARIIVDEFQSNGQHARTMESKSLNGFIRKDARAQACAAVLVLIGFGLIYQLAEHDHDGVAIAVAVTLLGSVLTAFLSGTVMSRRSERLTGGTNA